jgi:hypothetical protein
MLKIEGTRSTNIPMNEDFHGYGRNNALLLSDEDWHAEAGVCVCNVDLLT